MKTWIIFTKSLKEQIRDWRTLGISFLLPIFFMIVFGLAFGGGYYTYKIYVRNLDEGTGAGAALGAKLIQRLQTEQYEDGSRIFHLLPPASDGEMSEKLQKHGAAALITIPKEFSATLLTAKNSPSTPSPPATVQVEGDPAYPSFSLVKMIFDSLLADFAAEQTNTPKRATSETIYMGAKQKGSEFDYIAPGLMLFAIFMLIFQVSMVLVKESENGGLERMRLAGIRPRELLLGVGLTQVVFAVVMVPVMMASAVSVGFVSRGSLWAGMFTGVLASFSAIAVGLIIAAFCRNATQAFLISNAILVPVVFLSGVFFPLPNIPLFHIGDNVFTIFELQPATHAVNAFNRIFLYGVPLTDLAYELLMLTGVSGVYFLAGLLLWKKFHLKSS